MAKLVANTYGDALFELALEENKIDPWLTEVKVISEGLRENADLARIMHHPKIVKEEKLQLIENIFKGRVSLELVGLIRMIVEKDHFQELLSVFHYFIHRVKEYKNIGRAYVTSASALSEDQKNAVEKRLLETTHFVELEMHYEVDVTLMGGMVIRIGDRVVDSSIRTKLQNLTGELSKTQLKAGDGSI